MEHREKTANIRDVPNCLFGGVLPHTSVVDAAITKKFVFDGVVTSHVDCDKGWSVEWSRNRPELEIIAPVQIIVRLSRIQVQHT